MAGKGKSGLGAAASSRVIPRDLALTGKPEIEREIGENARGKTTLLLFVVASNFAEWARMNRKQECVKLLTILESLKDQRSFVIHILPIVVQLILAFK